MTTSYEQLLDKAGNSRMNVMRIFMCGNLQNNNLNLSFMK